MKKLLIIVLIFLAIDGIAQTSYQERIAYSKDTGLINKVRVASYNAAQAVIADTSETSRIIMPFANEVYSNPFGGWIDAMIMGVLTNPVITPASSDNDIQFTVNNGIFESVGKAWVGYITPVEADSIPVQGKINQNLLQLAEADLKK